VKQGVGADLARNRQDVTQVVTRLERVELSLERYLGAAVEQRVAAERWQSRMDATIENVAVRLGRIENLVTRLSLMEHAEAREAA